MKDQWSEAEYVVVRQVTDDIPGYKRYKTMVGMLRSSTTIGFSWWPPLEVMPHPWEEVSLLQRRLPPGPPEWNLLHWRGKVKCQGAKWIKH